MFPRFIESQHAHRYIFPFNKIETMAEYDTRQLESNLLANLPPALSSATGHSRALHSYGQPF